MEESENEIRKALRVACDSMMRLHHPDSEIHKTMEAVIADIDTMSSQEALGRYAVVAAVLEEQFSIGFAKPIRVRTTKGLKTFNKASELYKFLEQRKLIDGANNG
jgi:ribosome maturation protein Sdo1